MAYQLIVNVSSESILSSLKKVLNSMDGVSVEKSIKKKKTDTTATIMSDPEAMASIARGENDLANGDATIMTAAEARSMLGL